MGKKPIFKKKKVIYTIALVPLLVILGLFVWFFAIVFEGEKPDIALQPLPGYLSGNQKFTIDIRDMKRGLKTLKVAVKQEGREATLLEKRFPFRGLLNRDGVRHYEKEVFIDPVKLNLAQGRVDLSVSVWDYSRRGGGDGNINIVSHRMTVDTIPPAIRNISRMHNVNRGGSCLILYQVSSDTAESGVYMEDLFSPGFPAETASKKGVHVSYFTVPYNATTNPSLYLWARDKAGNRSKTGFYHHIRKRRFRKERINVTNNFLKRILPYFSFYPLDDEKSDIEKYIKINRDLRKEGSKILTNIGKEISPKRLWEGTWLRLSNAATMSRFADYRSYYYKGKKVDEQVHLGIDLASLANSPVPAANHGKVIFAKRLGIYGLTVVLDHGQGLMSLYGHLSQIDVAPGQEIKKGDRIGATGQTGLAGGDHLHFAILINGVPVNPIEWWDSHWIKDNITRKLALLKEYSP